MARKKNQKRITQGGLRPLPGQHGPSTILLSPPKRFGIDIATFIAAVRAADNIDYYRRTRLYDLYEDICIDTHLSSVMQRRKDAVNAAEVSFLDRSGNPVEAVNEQLRSPWFDRLVGDIIEAKFYGFSLFQFYRDEHGWITYDLIPRKHVDPVRRTLMRRQGEISGPSWDEYPNMLFVGQGRDLGMLLKAAPWVIWKRNDIADWAQFAEIFGMPIEDYTYDTGDDEARRRVIEDAQQAGSLKKYIHARDVELQLIEAGNKSGSADVYERLCEQCNRELSKLFLGNTLTTEAQDTGTQALGTVHKKEEDRILQADQKYVLNVLNYDMADIFASLGIDTTGGTFTFPEPKYIDLTAKSNILVQLRTNFRLPVGDDYLYETFGIERPQNYDALKQELEDEHALQQVISAGGIQFASGEEDQGGPDGDEAHREPDDSRRKGGTGGDQANGQRGRRSIRDILYDFFARAPRSRGAALEW